MAARFLRSIAETSAHTLTCCCCFLRTHTQHELLFWKKFYPKKTSQSRANNDRARADQSLAIITHSLLVRAPLKQLAPAAAAAVTRFVRAQSLIALGASSMKAAALYRSLTVCVCPWPAHSKQMATNGAHLEAKSAK